MKEATIGDILDECGSAPSPARHHLELLTESRAKTFRRCQKEHEFRYIKGYRPISIRDALRFGTLMHHGLEAWWLCGQPEVRLGDALLAIELKATEDTDPFELVRAQELMRGYHFRWGDEQLTAVAVEAEFRTPILNPDTGAASRTYESAGKMDVTLFDYERQRKVFMEHKTAARDIGAGSVYWAKLTIDGQVGTYFNGAAAIGHESEACIYDVIRKLDLRPYKATPLELREYTKPKYKQCPECRKKKPATPAPHSNPDHEGAAWACEDDPEGGPRRICTDAGGRLYANQRADDETVDEYRVRVRNEIADNPEKYYRRGEVVRLEAQQEEFAKETWQLAYQMKESRRLGIAPKNTDACDRYNSVCGYFSVCCGEASIDDPQLFEKLNWLHPELNPKDEG